MCFDMTTYTLFRSSLSWKHHIDVGAGVVDRDYRGNVGIVLFNLSKTDYEVNQRDRIAQLIVERIRTPPLVEVEVRNYMYITAWFHGAFYHLHSKNISLVINRKCQHILERTHLPKE